MQADSGMEQKADTMGLVVKLVQQRMRPTLCCCEGDFEREEGTDTIQEQAHVGAIILR